MPIENACPTCGTLFAKNALKGFSPNYRLLADFGNSDSSFYPFN